MKLSAQSQPKVVQRPQPSVAQHLQKLDVLGSCTIGDSFAAVGMAAAHTLAESPNVFLGCGMAAVHGARGAAFLLAAKGKSGVALQQRLGVAAGEGLMAVGNLMGAFGAGALCIPVMVAGASINLVADYRYRTAWENPEKPAVKPGPLLGTFQKSLNVADVAVAASSSSVPALGIAAGVGHVGMAAACYMGKGNLAANNTHSQHSKGYGHAMTAVGHLASAFGSGSAGWALVPILAGMSTTNLQDFRDRQLP